jgi:hypothetical protein
MVCLQMVCRVRAEAASALREAAKRLAETESELSQLRGDVHALQEELDNRPTAAEQRYAWYLFPARAERSCLLFGVPVDVLGEELSKTAGSTQVLLLRFGLTIDALHVKR